MKRSAALTIAVISALGAGVLIGRQTVKPVRVYDPTALDGGVYRVERVIDGDTIVLEDGIRVRYLLVDTPEMGRFEWEKKLQPGAQAATDANKKLVEGTRIRLRLGKSAMDKYGRILARVYVQQDEGEVDVGLYLLKNGYGKLLSVGGSETGREAARRAEAEAKSRKLGIWAEGSSVTMPNGPSPKK